MLNQILLQTKGLSWKEKWKFIYYEVFGLINLLRKRKSFVYFDHPFKYDNPSTLFTILLYPREVIEMIDENIDSPVTSLLDIGGNLGQFPITAANLFPKIKKIDILEPNIDIYGMLKSNVKEYRNIRIFPYGVGEDGKKDFFYVPNKSAKASLVSEYSVDPGDNPEKTEVELISDIPRITGRNTYDLVIVDVEGYEYEVLKCMKNINLKYLYIEMSVGLRRSYKSSDIYRLIYENWGDYNIINHSKWIDGAKYYDTLIEILGSSKQSGDKAISVVDYDVLKTADRSLLSP